MEGDSIRETAEKRHNDWKKAIRKKRISDAYCGDHPWYDNLHQYSKNKIHCSCPMCTHQSQTMSDRRKQESMDDQLKDLTFDEIDV